MTNIHCDIFPSRLRITLMLSAVSVLTAFSQTAGQQTVDASAGIIAADSVAQDTASIRKVLFIGDSMTGWMAERLNAYGEDNGFDVATVVWDGSTIKKWGSTPRLRDIIMEQKPDAIFVSLGMNELFESNPQGRLKNYVDRIKDDFAGIPFLWIGPPSWPGHTEGESLDSWLENELGERNYFRSSDLRIPRQSKSNPHPDRKGIEIWIDSVAQWIPDNSSLRFRSLIPPPEGEMKRGDIFIYKRMKEQL